MATIKSYTDLEQSKVLAGILPLESADMVLWGKDFKYVYADIHIQEFMKGLEDRKMNYVPCWSLAALLNFMKDKIIFGGNSPEGWFCCYTIKSPIKTLTIYEDSLVDACVSMIEKLHELKML